MAIFFLNYNINIVNTSTKESNFCTTTETDAQKGIIQADNLMFNEKIKTGLTFSNPLNNIIIVQQNKIRYQINCFQIKRFVRFVDHNIVYFQLNIAILEEKEEKPSFKKIFSLFKMGIDELQVQACYIIIKIYRQLYQPTCVQFQEWLMEHMGSLHGSTVNSLG